jgi:hypothetical protein
MRRFGWHLVLTNYKAFFVCSRLKPVSEDDSIVLQTTVSHDIVFALQIGGVDGEQSNRLKLSCKKLLFEAG